MKRLIAALAIVLMTSGVAMAHDGVSFSLGISVPLFYPYNYPAYSYPTYGYPYYGYPGYGYVAPYGYGYYPGSYYSYRYGAYPYRTHGGGGYYRGYPARSGGYSYHGHYRR